MPLEMILTGDINLMGMERSSTPFAGIARQLQSADVVFGNLECCLYDPPRPKSDRNPAFYAPATLAGDALAAAGFRAVGMANNVNFGEDAIMASVRRLDELGIAHTGAGFDLAAARAPAIVQVKGVRIGFLQRTSVYWAANHEAYDDAAGVAVIRGHTSYELPLHRDAQPMNRPGVGPIVRTWADPGYLQRFKDDLAGLRAQCDIVIASFHWGVGVEVLDYMSEIAHAAIDGGADAVIGHGPHHDPLPVEIHRGKPIFYGLGPIAFHTGHIGRTRGWTGIVASLSFDDGHALTQARFRFVRQEESMRVVFPPLADEGEAFDRMRKISGRYATRLDCRQDSVAIEIA